MKNLSLATITLAVATLASGAAFAAQPVELGRVTLTGYADNGHTIEPNTGMTYKDLFPQFYAAPSSVTRAQVLAEFMAARASRDDGDIVEPTSGLTLRTLHPATYPSTSTAVAKTRAEVRTEFLAARNALGAGDAIEPTTGRPMRVLFPNRYPEAGTRTPVQDATAQARPVGTQLAVNP